MFLFQNIWWNTKREETPGVANDSFEHQISLLLLNHFLKCVIYLMIVWISWQSFTIFYCFNIWGFWVICLALLIFFCSSSIWSGRKVCGKLPRWLGKLWEFHCSNKLHQHKLQSKENRVKNRQCKTSSTTPLNN
jgi:hypothetical protein